MKARSLSPRYKTNKTSVFFYLPPTLTFYESTFLENNLISANLQTMSTMNSVILLDLSMLGITFFSKVCKVEGQLLKF